MNPVRLSLAYEIRSVCQGIGFLCLLVAVKAHGCILRDNGDGTMTEPSSGLLM